MNKDIKVSLMCIAKDEDNYIDEWIDYHFKIGFDNIIIYKNNWNYNCNIKDKRLILQDWNYVCDQKKLASSYDDFIMNNYHNYDWGFFLDCDEFLNIPHIYNIKTILNDSIFIDVPALAIHWKMFGDNGQTNVCNGNYSVIDRFRKCQLGFNRGHKSAINFNICKNRCFYRNWCHVPLEYFDGFYMMDIQSIDKHSQYKNCFEKYKDCMYINHYNVKTREEYLNNKQKRNEKLDPDLYKNIEQNWNNCNKNEVEDKSMYNFYFKGII